MDGRWRDWGGLEDPIHVRGQADAARALERGPRRRGPRRPRGVIGVLRFTEDDTGGWLLDWGHLYCGLRLDPG